MIVCELCGEPMPEGEEMFKYHGYSGPCPKPHLPRPKRDPWAELERLAREIDPTLPADLSNYEVRITLHRDYQTIQCEWRAPHGQT